MFEEIMKKETEQIIFVSVDTKKYPLSIYETSEENEIYIICEAADMKQPYGKNDLMLLITDLPNMIRDTLLERKTALFQFRVSPQQKAKLEQNAQKNGYKSVSEFIKDRCLI